MVIRNAHKAMKKEKRKNNILHWLRFVNTFKKPLSTYRDRKGRIC